MKSNGRQRYSAWVRVALMGQWKGNDVLCHQQPLVSSVHLAEMGSLRAFAERVLVVLSSDISALLLRTQTDFPRHRCSRSTVFAWPPEASPFSTLLHPVSIGIRMRAEVEERVEAVPGVGLEDLGPGVAVVPVGQVVVEGAVVLPTTRARSLHNYLQWSH